VNELSPEFEGGFQSWVEDCDVTLDEVEVAMRSLASKDVAFGPSLASVAFSRPGGSGPRHS
jgi:hypothetical protein